MLARTMMWIEANTPHEPNPEALPNTQVENQLTWAVRTAGKWQELGVLPIVSTSFDHFPSVYDALDEQGGRFMGGTKSSYYITRLGDLLSPTVWRAMGDGLARVRTLTGERIVVLDNETTLYPYTTEANALTEKGLNQLTTAVQGLLRSEFDGTILMAVPCVSEEPDLQDWTEKLVKAVKKGVEGQTTVNMLFLSSFMAWGPQHAKQEETKVAEKRMNAAAGETGHIPIVFAQRDGIWPPRDDSDASPVWSSADIDREEFYAQRRMYMANGMRILKPCVLYPGNNAELIADDLQHHSIHG